MLPTMLVIGARKAATTSLWASLDQHPQTWFPRKKELHFFDVEKNWRRGPEWYVAKFAGAPSSAQAVGEATPGYTRYPHVPDVPRRAHGLVPDARLVYVLREPIARLRSDYLHDVRAGVQSRPFAQAVGNGSIYLAASRYAMQIEQWLDFYDRSQLLLVTTEELAADPAGTMRRVYAHVGADPDFVPRPVQLNRTDGKRNVRPALAGWRHSRPGRAALKVLPRALTDRPTAPDEAVLTPQLRAELIRQLHDDLVRLRAYMPPGFDGWGLL